MDPSDLDRKDVRRPMNAFLIFCKRHRSIVREKNPSLDNRSVTRILGDLWANLGDDEKSQYTDLAKQYKDAFMKANPDYKWHNPERVAPPASNKPNTRPTNVRVLKSENDINIEGQITPGKLADPSNMGGLSLLLDSSKYSLTSTISCKVGDKQILEADSISSNTETETSLYTNVPGNVKSDISNDDVEIKMLPSSKKKDENDENEETGTTATTEEKDKDENGNKFKENESGNHGNMTDEGPISLVQGKGDNKDVLSASEGIEEQNKNDSVNMSGSEVTEVDPIVGCGQRVMDHIIERLFTIEKHQSAFTKDLKMEETTTETCTDEVDGTRKGTEENTTTDTSSINDKPQKSFQVFEKNMAMKLPFSPQKSSERSESSETKKRKRCYSESNVDTYESSKPIIKKEKLDIEEELQNSEIDGCSQSDECLEQTELASQDMEKTTDQDSADDDSHPIRKSKRRNRGQRYQELINEGIIQPSRERLASMKGDNIVKEESTTEDKAISNKYDELAHDVLSVYPRQIRKRTVSESEKSKPIVDDIKRYKTGDFDLEAHIATLPACSLEKVARNAKRSIIKVRSHSDSSKKSDSDKSDVILALPVPPHLKLKNSSDTGPPPTGSQKRKARKHSVTRLIPVSSTAGISLVAVKTDDQNEETQSDNTDKNDMIAKSLLNCEKASDDDGQQDKSDCCHGDSYNLQERENMDSSENMQNNHKQKKDPGDSELLCENSEEVKGQVVMVTDNYKSGVQQQDMDIEKEKCEITQISKNIKSKDCLTEDYPACNEKGDNVQNFQPSVLEKRGNSRELNVSKCIDKEMNSDNQDQGNDGFKERKKGDDTTISCSIDSNLSDKSENVQLVSPCEVEMKKSFHLDKASGHVSSDYIQGFHGNIDNSMEGKEETASQQRDSVENEDRINLSTRTCDKEDDMTCDSKELDCSAVVSTSISHVHTSTSDSTMSHATAVQPGMSIVVQSS